MSQFKLSASLKGHEDDVRAVAFPDPSTILTASRDATVRRWQLKSSSPPTYDDSLVSHGESFVNSIAYAPPFSAFKEGLYFSGGKDTIIDVRQIGRPPDQDAERLLLGHEGNVCSLAFCKDSATPYLVSGSWDGSARVWDVEKGESRAVLEGHQGSVWAVLAYDREHVITACADNLIRVFEPTGRLLRTLKGSEDVVRALCKLPPQNDYSAHFASAGNDNIIRLWTLEGQEVAQLHGHENFIYSLAVLPTGELVSSSEDRTARVWRGRECIQTITHPAISVWSVAADPSTGDIVTGASDRIARVFSRDASRHADAETLKAFEDSVASSSIPQQQTQVNKSQLPGPEFLQNKSGTKDGQVQMIAEHNGTISAHQWSASGNTWINVGSVVDSSGSSGRKQNYNGQDYDYVFDVDIEDGKPPLKLPFNLNQNPHEAAQKFIADNNLPTSYAEQTAMFIINNTQGASLGQSDSAPSSQPQPPPPAIQPRQPILPQKDYLAITTASFPAMKRKIAELNSKLLADNRKDIALAPQELQNLSELCDGLEKHDYSAPVPEEYEQMHEAAVEYVERISTQWPPEFRIPGLDLLRCLAPTAAGNYMAAKGDILAILGQAGAFETGQEANANVTMLATRVLANLFVAYQGRVYLMRNLDELRGRISPATTQGAARNTVIAAATVYINMAVLLIQSRENISGENDNIKATLCEDLLTMLADSKIVDSEVVYRCLVALGTLVVGSETKCWPARCEAVVRKAGLKTREPRVRNVVGEIVERLEKK